MSGKLTVQGRRLDLYEPNFTTSLPRREWFPTRKGWASRERVGDPPLKITSTVKQLLKSFSPDELSSILSELREIGDE